MKRPFGTVKKAALVLGMFTLLAGAGRTARWYFFSPASPAPALSACQFFCSSSVWLVQHGQKVPAKSRGQVFTTPRSISWKLEKIRLVN
jgi:hypothetical protein